MELALDERINKMSHHRRLANGVSWPIEDLADLNFKLAFDNIGGSCNDDVSSSGC